MSAYIEFILGKKEEIIPTIRLTKSKNGKTGTATFLFIQPLLFKQKSNYIPEINGMYLIWENKKIKTNDITIRFRNGKPFLLKAVFLFRNSKEWFQFLNFMTCYSKETGLLFTEKNTSF